MPAHSTANDGDAPVAQQRALFSGLRVVGLCTLLSRVLGLIRDMGMAALFGLSPIADHFVVAFSVPNLARRVFGEGAVSASFLPVLTRELQQSGRESVWNLASAVFTLLSVALTLLVFIGELGLWGAQMIWPDAADVQVLLSLTAVMLPYLIFVCIAAQISAVLHVLGHFALPALAPVVLNVLWIGSLWLIAPQFEPNRLEEAYVIAWTILFAGVCQIGIQWPVLRRFGFQYQIRWQTAWPRIKEILWAMLPVMLGLSTTLFNTLSDRLIAWSFSRYLTHPPLEEGAAAALYYAQRFYQFPVGVFGVALGTVLFPLLARHAAENRVDLLRQDLTLGLRLVITIGLPASAGLVLLAHPLSQALLEYGKFGDTAALRTAALTAAYGIGVWASCGQLILYRGFYALDDRHTPLKIGLFSVVVNLALNLTLIWPLGGRGLAYGTSLAAMLQVGLLLWTIQSHCGQLPWSQLITTTLRAGVATGIMAAVCLISLWLLGPGEDVTSRILRLAIPFVLSIAAYYLAALLLGLDEIQMLLRRKPVDSRSTDR